MSSPGACDQLRYRATGALATTGNKRHLVGAAPLARPVRLDRCSDHWVPHSRAQAMQPPSRWFSVPA